MILTIILFGKIILKEGPDIKQLLTTVIDSRIPSILRLGNNVGNNKYSTL
jgi:hypothetical protein